MGSHESSRRVLDLCDRALELADEAREAFLAEACGDDAALRSSVDSVLLAVSAAGDFLQVEPARDGDAGALVGTSIGSYRILEKLGEGGMGAVYLAERTGDDFVQRVAIKLVQRHLLARELVERFHAERRILAGLSHPYIAGLIDGGTTSQGVPYLVMEHVEGAPIDEYCDRQG